MNQQGYCLIGIKLRRLYLRAPEHEKEAGKLAIAYKSYNDCNNICTHMILYSSTQPLFVKLTPNGLN